MGIHKDTAQKYISYISDAFLIFEVPFFSYSAKTKYIASRASKYYVIDNGFHTIACIKKNTSHLYENAVAIQLKRADKEIMHWLDEAEIDFIYDKTAVQVTSSEKIPRREIKAFSSFNNRYAGFENILINPAKKGRFNRLKILGIKEFLVN